MLRQIAQILGVRTAVLLGESPRDSGEPGRPQVADLERAMFTYQTLTDGDLEPADAEQVAERLTAARDAWYTSPHKYTILMQRLPGLISDAERLVLAASPSPDQRRHAGKVAADVYILARGVLKHIGRIDLAHLAADRAMRYAEESGDPLITAWAHWNLGQSMLTDDMHDIAYQVARIGMERLEPQLPDGDHRHLSVFGGLHLMAAIAASRSGDAEGARELLRGRVQQIAQRVDETRPMIGLFFGPQNVAMHMVAVELEARRPADAIRLADDIDLTKVMSVERRTSHLLHVAKACEDTCDDAASLLYLIRIERECPEELDHKSHLRDMVRSLAERARPSWAPEVRYLAERHKIFI
jgi:hypothetical protein